MLERVLHGGIGMLALCGVGILCSADRRAIRPRLIAGALLLQVAIGALALFVPAGRALFAFVASAVGALLSYGDQGTAFVFGDLGRSSGFVFALRVLPQIVFVSGLIEVLFYTGVLRRLADAVGVGVAWLLGCSRITAFAAVITIFLGQSELPIAIRPAVARLTRAELFATMSSGFASVAGSVLAGYAALGIGMHALLAASFMAIPGGLLFANLLLPERERGDAAPLRADAEVEGIANVFEALAVGAGRGLRIAAMVGATLIAFIGLIALLNEVVAGAGRAAGWPGLSLEAVFGSVFAPVAWLIGVPGHASAAVGQVIGEKLVFNEFVAYVRLAAMQKAGSLTDPRAVSIATFALCGFANFTSVAIVLAAFGGVAPARRSEIARLALRAVLAGTLSNLMSADIAGMFIA